MSLIHNIAKSIGREVIYPVGRTLVDFGLKGSLSDRVGDIDKMVDVQTAAGNWDANSYMRGMANGLLLAQHTMHGWDGDPAFLEEPIHGYLADTPEKRAEYVDKRTPSDLRNVSVSLDVENYNDDEEAPEPVREGDAEAPKYDPLDDPEYDSVDFPLPDPAPAKKATVAKKR